jgi:uncharacterized membrane protein
VTLYRVLLFVHVLGAAAWVGGGLFAFLMSLNIQKSGDGARLAAYGREVGEFGGKYFAPAAIVTVLAGIWLVIEGDWGFDHFWIMSAFAVWIYSIVSNVTWMDKLAKSIETGAAERGPQDPAVKAAADRLFMWRVIEIVLLVYVIFAMTYKPFFE